MKARIETTKDFDPKKTKVFDIDTNEELKLITSIVFEVGTNGHKKGTVKGFIPKSTESSTPLRIGGEFMRYMIDFEIGEIKIIE